MKCFFNISDLVGESKRSGKAYSEFLRIEAMSAGVYLLPAAGIDRQNPHREDELYYIVRGRARMRVGEEDEFVSPGTIVFVKAGVEHRFHDIEQDLEVLVFFAPAET